MKLLNCAAVLAAVSFAQPAFAMSDADCKAEWTKADVNKDNFLTDLEAAPYLSKLRMAGKPAPADGKITPAIFDENCKADVFATAAKMDASPTAVKADAKMDVGAPLKGANSFTEAQAKDRILAVGLSNVSSLKKDADGIWRGTASKDSKTINVAVDFKGNVVSN